MEGRQGENSGRVVRGSGPQRRRRPVQETLRVETGGQIQLETPGQEIRGDQPPTPYSFSRRGHVGEATVDAAQVRSLVSDDRGYGVRDLRGRSEGVGRIHPAPSAEQLAGGGQEKVVGAPDGIRGPT